ncbi:hypothetical protein V1505DRAFT_373556 [Lipomyces doorenjongii]
MSTRLGRTSITAVALADSLASLCQLSLTFDYSMREVDCIPFNHDSCESYKITNYYMFSLNLNLSQLGSRTGARDSLINTVLSMSDVQT